MKRFLAAAFLFLSLIGLARAETDALLTRQVNAFVDEWHDDAANARMAYFDKIAPDGVYISGDKSLIWFDELLDTPNMGPCMASGVIRKTAKGFEIVHYQLSMAVPNEVAGQVTELIAGHDKTGKQAGK